MSSITTIGGMWIQFCEQWNFTINNVIGKLAKEDDKDIEDDGDPAEESDGFKIKYEFESAMIESEFERELNDKLEIEALINDMIKIQKWNCYHQSRYQGMIIVWQWTQMTIVPSKMLQRAGSFQEAQDKHWKKRATTFQYR